MNETSSAVPVTSDQNVHMANEILITEYCHRDTDLATVWFHRAGATVNNCSAIDEHLRNCIPTSHIFPLWRNFLANPFA
jgi:hypothetical protein